MGQTPILVYILMLLAVLPTPGAVQDAPLLTTGQVPSGSPASGLGQLTDGKWGGGWAAGNGAWLAFKLTPGPTRLLFSWNVPAYSWSDELAVAGSCKQSGGIDRPVDYDLMTSSNSTDGQNGDWTTALDITGNPVSSRMHYVPFTGKSWVKLRIRTGKGSLDEVQVFDASAPNPEAWIIVGNSITAGAFSTAMPAGSDFQSLVKKAVPGRVPARLRAGIPCIRTKDVSGDMGRYLEMGKGASIWGLSLGTNDAWGGGKANLANYRESLLRIADSLEAHGLQPVIARFSATAPSRANWQVDASYLSLIDSVTKARKLVPGPDLYGWFLAHPEELGSDGVHPNETGYVSIQRLWAGVAAGIAHADPVGIRRPRSEAAGRSRFSADRLEFFRAYELSGRRLRKPPETLPSGQNSARSPR